jgi:hypothetical protein
MSEDRMLALLEEITVHVQERLNPGWRAWPVHVHMQEAYEFEGPRPEVTMQWHFYRSDPSKNYENPFYPNKERHD